MPGERHQGLVHTLARQAHQIGQLLLGDAQHVAHAGVQHWVEQGGQAARHPDVGVGHAVNFARGDELAQTFIKLFHDEAIEANRVVQQPVEGVDVQPGHHAVAQRLDVVTVDFALEGRALAKPAARGYAGKGHALAGGVVAAHLEQAVHHAKPVGHGAAYAANVVTGTGIGDLQVVHGPFALFGGQQAEPGNGVEFDRIQWSAALVKGVVGGHKA